VSDESGVALGLAVIMVVLVGVMGAGLLTLVAANLQTVVAINRGQQAFEMSEAGVEVEDLPDTGTFRVVSVGRYADARRVIEATLDVVDGEPRTMTWRWAFAVMG
jgi:hypothetical protein